MKFMITNTSWNDGDKIIEKYPILDDYGYEEIVESKKRIIRIRDENGKPLYQEVTVPTICPYVNIDTLEQLMDLIKKLDCKQIVLTCADVEWTGKDTIEIYDGYRE